MLFPRFFSSTEPEKVPEGFAVVEGVTGVWHYHLRRATATAGPALCGAQVMHTGLPYERWGVPFGEHFPKKPTWCAHCQRMKDLVPA